MDDATLGAYDRAAAAFAEEWNAQPAPADMQALLHRFFGPGPTADIGCGAGRDTAWLDRNGFPAIGYDASDGLIAEARRRHPALRFEKAALPALDGIAPASFANVLCETVIMHLAPATVAAAVGRLIDILRSGGTLYLSWRVTEGAERRDEYGRLYAAVDPAQVFEGLGDAAILFDDEPVSQSSGKRIRRVVARKP
ncbi:hypothetical protein GCM10011611_44800 [Aliidongia dinghuensis]|uniref:Methyltransferase domain-containing protein n=1 Tax=Aliidongia dinghuensis TaxID=1867774 RepID=A0A8J2YWV1_9PROT|nr:class I SAM-dependent methyltransferase [Aliidongia dinghuensis]GGF33593.1 hypothetical protein GCM10011611_44800 [Aliidongia dinghuensis]